MEEVLEDLDEEFDIVETLDHKDSRALAHVREGATAEVDGETYVVEEYGKVSGEWYIAGNEAEEGYEQSDGEWYDLEQNYHD